MKYTYGSLGTVVCRVTQGLRTWRKKKEFRGRCRDCFWCVLGELISVKKIVILLVKLLSYCHIYELGITN